MKRRTLPGRCAGGAAGAVAALAMLAVAPAQADAVDASVARLGWWSQQPGAQAQPAGGFQIAAAGGSTQSVAAVDVKLGDGINPATKLTLTQGQSVGTGASVQACKVTRTWTPANPGAFAAAPTYDCARAVALTFDGTASWSGDISSLVNAGGTTSVMLVPSGVATSGFQLTFTKAAVAATGAAPPSTTTTSTTPTPPPEQVVSPAVTSAPDRGSFVVPAPEPTVDLPPTTFAAVAPRRDVAVPNEIAAPVVQPIPAGLAIQAPRSGGGRPWTRVVVFAPLACLVGVATVVLRRAGVIAP